MDELPAYFWLHITSTVVLAVLALVATAVALAVDEVSTSSMRLGGPMQ